jgi:hypothetical protein
MGMKTHRSFFGMLVSSIIAGLLVIGAGVASAGHLGSLLTSTHKTVRAESSCAPSDQSTVQASSDDQGEDQQGEDQECEEPEGDGTTAPADEGNGDSKPAPSADRGAACKEAAGITDEAGSPSGDGIEAPEKTTGLDHAVEVVMANCIKNPQAPGLLNALRHLVANRDRHMAHEQEKAARRAAREAAKAARHHGHGGEGS